MKYILKNILYIFVNRILYKQNSMIPCYVDLISHLTLISYKVLQVDL